MSLIDTRRQQETCSDRHEHHDDEKDDGALRESGLLHDEPWPSTLPECMRAGLFAEILERSPILEMSRRNGRVRTPKQGQQPLDFRFAFFTFICRYTKPFGIRDVGKPLSKVRILLSTSSNARRLSFNTPGASP